MRTHLRRNVEDKLEIGVLYGFRALMVLLVMNYHIWQQSWLGQYATVLGMKINFDFWTRSGFLFVDGMILLSGFLLYLPYARQLEEGTPVPGTRRFYLNRASRILPSYLFAVTAALLCIALPQRMYSTAGEAVWDVTAHLTFTFLCWPQTYLYTPLNVALWTIAVEVQFYLIFPLLARAAQKHPVQTLSGMAVVAWIYRLCVARFMGQQLAQFINQMPAFLDVYALGMLGAALFCRLKKHEKRWFAWISPAAFALGAWALREIFRIQSASGSAGYAALQLSQMRVRLPLALTFLCLMLSAAFWPRMLQRLLDNRLMRFLSTLSMNLYIWHQVLAVEMRKAWFPDLDQLHSDVRLQSAYTLLCFSVAILAAMAATFGLEQPAARWMKKRGTTPDGKK